MPRIEVFVSAEDIEEGRRRNTWTCPLCLALWLATGVKWVVEESIAYHHGPERIHPCRRGDHVHFGI